MQWTSLQFQDSEVGFFLLGRTPETCRTDAKEEEPHLAPFFIPLLPRNISSNTGFLWNHITTTTLWRKKIMGVEV